MPLAGDDSDALQTSAQFVRDAGCELGSPAWLRPLASREEGPCFGRIRMRLNYFACSEKSIEGSLAR